MTLPVMRQGMISRKSFEVGHPAGILSDRVNPVLLSVLIEGHAGLPFFPYFADQVRARLECFFAGSPA